MWKFFPIFFEKGFYMQKWLGNQLFETQGLQEEDN